MLLTIQRLIRCITNETAHFERHREIARLVNQLQSCDNGNQTPIRGRKQSKAMQINEDHSINDESTATDVSSNDPTTPEVSLADDVDDIDAVETSNSRSAKRAFRRSIKDKQDQNKAFKNQQRIVLTVSQAHVDRVAKAIHGSLYNVNGLGGHPGTNKNNSDAFFDRDDTYKAALRTHRLWFSEQERTSRARHRKKGSEAQRKQLKQDIENGLSVQEPDMEELVSVVLSELGIPDHGDASSNLARSSFKTAKHSRKHRSNTLLQLRREIAADIEKSENERRARQQRTEGYWRYVSGTVTNRLANNAQVTDRSTGVRLKAEPAPQSLAGVLEKDLVEENDGEGEVDYDKESEETAESLQDL